MQLICLKSLEEVGPAQKGVGLAQCWLDHIGYNWDEYGVNKTNLRLGLMPPVSGRLQQLVQGLYGLPDPLRDLGRVSRPQPRASPRCMLT